MKFELEFDRTYPHSIDRVWRALTSREALAEWLMTNDFVAETGRDFRLWCDDGAGGTDTYLCRVLALEPMQRMVWSWLLEGGRQKTATEVEFRLAVVTDGTRLTLLHRGDRDRTMIDRFKGGWPVKLEQLDTALGPR